MMCFDLGGPVNKAAYAFATAGLSVDRPGELRSWPRSCSPAWCRRWRWRLRDVCGRKLFNRAGAGERQGGVAARRLVHLRGCDPVRGGRPAARHPGDACRAARSPARCRWRSTSGCSAPHGGIFVLFAVDGIFGFFVALAAGTIVGGARASSPLKSMRRRPADTEQAEAVAGPRRDPHARIHVTQVRPQKRNSFMASITVKVGSSVGLHARPGSDHLREGWRARRRRHLGGARWQTGRRGLGPADHDARRLARRRGRGVVRRRRGGRRRSPTWWPGPRRLTPTATSRCRLPAGDWSRTSEIRGAARDRAGARRRDRLWRPGRAARRATRNSPLGREAWPRAPTSMRARSSLERAARCAPRTPGRP